MVNYENGKIYRLKSKSTNQSYIGSTSMPYLSQRLAEHLHNFKTYQKKKIRYMTSFKILECDDYEIELIANFPCANKQQLEREEGKYIKLEKEENKYNCVNQVIAGRTLKEYCADNKEKRKENHKKFRDVHKEKIKDYQQEFYAENKEKIVERQKKYYEANKEKINVRQSEKVICVICDCLVRKDGLKRHQQTLKCKSVANK